MPMGIQGVGAVPVAGTGSDASTPATCPPVPAPPSGDSPPPFAPDGGTPALGPSGKGAPGAPLPLPPASGNGAGGTGELDTTPAAALSPVDDPFFGFASRGGGEIGNASPAAATRASAVTQTGVWSLEAE